MILTNTHGQPPELPAKTLTSLEDIGMSYVAYEDRFITKNGNGRKRQTHCRIDWSEGRLFTTFNTTHLNKDYPNFLMLPKSPEEHLETLEAIMQSIVDVHGEMQLLLTSGMSDIELLKQNDYMRVFHENRYFWCKTFAPVGTESTD